MEGRQQNRVLIGESLAVLLCPTPNGKTFGVTIDREDVERVLAAGFWRVTNFSNQRKNRPMSFYAYTSCNRRVVYLHRFILSAPVGVQVDHRHHRQLDNRKSEIGLATRSEQMKNRRPWQLPPRNERGHWRTA